MVKISKILAFLILIFHVHLTTTLLTHVLEERNLTMLLANRSGHELKKRGPSYKHPFNPLKIKGTIFVRPANIPERIRLLEITLACAQLRTFVAFCICCALNNRNVLIDEPQSKPIIHPIWSDDFINQHVHGPNLRKMFYKYRRSDYYNRMYFDDFDYIGYRINIPKCPTSEAIPIYEPNQQLKPCQLNDAENILRPYDPTTDLFASKPSGPSKLQYKSTVKEFSLNAPGFSEFFEILILLQYKPDIIDYFDSRRPLLDKYDKIYNYLLAEETDIKHYFTLIYKFGEKINSYLHKLTSLVNRDGSVSQSIAGLTIMCDEDKYIYSDSL
ncbi:hypothetical protein C2G38_2156099 [Gigaspora rosea]|uniref:Uncharacterized protein n=1 Tax=Gigaspora rosea TaxID=44941 RepID=A0A397W6D6_9GLOM|nr:hypothetical protein C2G38_2156099 [Gigaspora rosea]